MRLRLPARLDVVPEAREALRPFRAELPGTAYNDLLLLVSETVTNAVRHAGASEDAAIELEVEARDGVVRVVVFDEGPGFEARPAPDPGDHGGWGLRLVDRVAARWGTGREPRAHVWFELQRAR